MDAANADDLVLGNRYAIAPAAIVNARDALLEAERVFAWAAAALGVLDELPLDLPPTVSSLTWAQLADRCGRAAAGLREEA
jgi:hypothetical protein